MSDCDDSDSASSSSSSSSEGGRSREYRWHTRIDALLAPEAVADACRRGEAAAMTHKVLECLCALQREVCADEDMHPRAQKMMTAAEDVAAVLHLSPPGARKTSFMRLFIDERARHMADYDYRAGGDDDENCLLEDIAEIDKHIVHMCTLGDHASTVDCGLRWLASQGLYSPGRYESAVAHRFAVCVMRNWELNRVGDVPPARKNVDYGVRMLMAAPGCLPAHAVGCDIPAWVACAWAAIEDVLTLVKHSDKDDAPLDFDLRTVAWSIFAELMLQRSPEGMSWLMSLQNTLVRNDAHAEHAKLRDTVYAWALEAGVVTLATSPAKWWCAWAPVHWSEPKAQQAASSHKRMCVDAE